MSPMALPDFLSRQTTTGENYIKLFIRPCAPPLPPPFPVSTKTPGAMVLLLKFLITPAPEKCTHLHAQPNSQRSNLPSLALALSLYFCRLMAKGYTSRSAQAHLDRPRPSVNLSVTCYILHSVSCPCCRLSLVHSRGVNCMHAHIPGKRTGGQGGWG